MSDPQKLRERAQAVFARNLEMVAQARIREWVDLFAEDGTLEFPYCPPGIPWRFTGHEALYEHMRHFPEQLDLTFSEPVFHETTDPELVIAEFTGTGTAVPTGRPVNQTFISVVRTRDGRITLFRDFWNPLVILEALGGMDALAEIDAA
jgi:uncharacterized protein